MGTLSEKRIVAMHKAWRDNSSSTGEFSEFLKGQQKYFDEPEILTLADKITKDMQTNHAITIAGSEKYALHLVTKDLVVFPKEPTVSMIVFLSQYLKGDNIAEDILPELRNIASKKPEWI